MAVNRFSQFAQPAQVQPLSFQNLAAAPSYMRQQEDTLQAGILENSILAANVAKQDSQLAKNFLEPIEQSFQEMSSELAKKGFSQDMKRKFINLKTNLAKTQRDIIQPLEQKKAAIAAEVERLEELYKDDPQTLTTNISRFMAAQQGASIDPKTGKLVGTGVNTNIWMGKVLDQKELSAILNDTMQGLRASTLAANRNLRSEDVQAIGDYHNLITFAKKNGVTQAQIANIIKQTGGNALKSHFRQVGLNENRLPQTQKALEQTKQRAINGINNDERLSPEDKAERIAGINSIETPEQYQEFVAEQQTNAFAINAGANLEYSTIDYDRKIIEDKQAIYNLNNPPKKEFWPTVFSARQSTNQMSNLANHDPSSGLSDRDRALAIVGDLEDRYRANDDTETRRVKAQQWQDEVDRVEKMIQDPTQDPYVKSILEKNTQLRNNIRETRSRIMQENPNISYKKANKQAYTQSISEYNGFYKNLGETYNLAKAIPEDKAEGIKNMYVDRLQEFKLVHPQEGEMDFQTFRDNYASGDLQDFYKQLRIKNVTNVVGHGNMIEATYNDGAESKTIFIQSPIPLDVGSAKSQAVDEGLIANEPIIELPVKREADNTITKEFAIPNYKTGKIDIYAIQNYDPETSPDLNYLINLSPQELKQKASNVAKYPFSRVIDAERNNALEYWRNVEL